MQIIPIGVSQYETIKVLVAQDRGMGMATKKQRKDFKLRLVYLDYMELIGRGYTAEQALTQVSEYTHATVMARLHALIASMWS